MLKALHRSVHSVYVINKEFVICCELNKYKILLLINMSIGAFSLVIKTQKTKNNLTLLWATCML